MADRYPLIANPSTNKIEELAAYDNLNLTNSGIVSATTIQADQFIGDLTGTATTAINLSNAANITTGTINPNRLSGTYDIDISGVAANSTRLQDAANIDYGTISPARLNGVYPIDISGVAANSTRLQNAANIDAGTIDPARLTGVYNISITGNASNANANQIYVSDEQTDQINYILSAPAASGLTTANVDSVGLVYNPGLDLLGVGNANPTEAVDVVGNIKASGNYYGTGETLAGIVTTLVAGIGISLSPTTGKGKVTVTSFSPVGKTIFVNQNGSDTNTGLTENNAKRTIKSAAELAFFGDTIKVTPGVYVENNPIILRRGVGLEGLELRNCIVTPQNSNKDLFHVNNSVHITNFSFIGPASTEGAAIVAFQPLAGVASDRFFDAARMIRMNSKFIAKESVGFLTSGFSGFAGSHREQDAARLIDKNLNYIAAEAVGFLTTSVGSGGYGFSLSNSDYTNCKEDIVSVMSAVSYDLKANSNRKSIGAGYSYFNSSGGLIHITGISTQQATIAAFNYAIGIATCVINNVTPIKSFQSGIGSISQTKDLSVIQTPGGCVGVGTTIAQLVGIVTTMIGAASTLTAPALRYGVNLEVEPCARDVEYMLRAVCHDITRGGNSKCVAIGKSYYNPNGTPILDISQNTSEYQQTVETFRYAADIARSVVNNCTWGGYPVGLGTTVASAIYGKETGITTITAYNHGLSKNDSVKIVGLAFTCPNGSGITTTIFPNGKFGYVFPVKKVIDSNTFEFVGGISTITHTYNSGGTIQKYTTFQNNFTQVKDLSIQIDDATGFNDSINSCQNVISSIYSCVGVVTTIVGNGLSVLGVGINTTYPGNSGIGTTNPNDPSFSPGVGPITQGPYIRNCTNFIPNSIGMKVDGFNAEPGDQEDIGVTGSMSVDSYTQYNQGGIGVSITNGAYTQLVSIFTICNDTAIYTGSGGQCDITNSNSSFGTYGLVSDGIGDETTKSIYRYTGFTETTVNSGKDTVVISGLGTNRPYQGQAIYFGKIYYLIDSIEVIDGGSGYTKPPNVIIDFPTGPNGIKAEGSANIQNGKVVSVDLISTGNQYETVPNVTFSSGSATAIAKIIPIYYGIESATLPSAGISTVVLSTNLNNTVGSGTTVYFARTSLQLASSICFEYIGAGNDINRAKPALGGVVVPQNQVVKRNGAQLVYTSTDQSGNFRIGDGVIINQNTGTITGRAFSQSLLNTVTPLIVALSK